MAKSVIKATPTARVRGLRALLLASTMIGASVAGSGPALAQTPSAAPDGRETIVVVGSQIAGSRATDAVAVTVVREEQLDAIAATSGDELFRAIPQLGDVSFNTSRTIGTVNDARGDTASINLRALGTGNTLVLLNGRRMVNHPGTQAENLVPVVTVNANAIPVTGISRVEVLLDGASALYGADAVAGVVNTVLKTEFDGLNAELGWAQEEGVDAPEFTAALEWGQTFNDGRTNLSLFANYFTKDPVFARDRDFTARADHSYRLPADWAGTTAFNNTSTTSAWGGFDRLVDLVPAAPIRVNGVAVTNNAGQFHIQPDTLPGCLANLGNGLCIDDTLTRDQALRFDVNTDASVSNGVDRTNAFLFLNNEFGGGLELFGEAGVYLADSVGYREMAPLLGAVPIVIPATNYWNPFGPVGSPNRIAGSNAPAGGLAITLNGYRPVDAGASRFEVENLSTRMLAGLRGDFAGWNWESALLYSRADSEDVTNRISNTLFQQTLARSTPDAYNPFNGGCLSNPGVGDCTPSPAAALADISVLARRRNSTSLALWDAKVSRPDLFSLWAGAVGVAAGVELRREGFKDDRDPRQDGTVNFTDIVSGQTTNDLQGNSPSGDTKGSRDVASAFVEFAVPLVSPEMNIPLVQDLNLQLAARHEEFETFGGVTKPKAALSWRLSDFLMLRSAWSQGFRAPNLQQQFETGLQRSNVRNDWARCDIATGTAPVTPANCAAAGFSQSVISNRQGSLALEPEESENVTAGVVFESTFLPEALGELSVTADWWRVKQEGVVGIFGDDNQILLDYALRTQGGFNPAVVRGAPEFAGDIGDILVVDDNYLNLNQREVEGWDFGLYYSLDDTAVGDFDLTLNAAYLDSFFQDVSPQGQVINDAIAAGQVPPIFLVTGEGQLKQRFVRPEWRYSATLTWRKDAWGAGWFTSYVGEVYDPEIVRASDNAIWTVESHQTHNAYLQYAFGADGERPARLRIGVRNLFDETPPLADTNFGYLGDLHSPAGRSFYASLRKEF
jgi:iron complex outermembrane recepter protein